MNDRKRPMPDDMIDLIEQAREKMEGVDRVSLAISEAIDWDNAKMEEVIPSLLDTLVFCLSLTCAGCRNTFANDLRERLPQLIAKADEMDEGNPQHQHLLN